ncbi:MAG: redoxin domain-containing protein [Myxococcales bacterium]|nr:redoxin domain-containing protein [Myxococcales bacterium]
MTLTRRLRLGATLSLLLSPALALAAGPRTPGPEPGQEAPAFSLTGSDGKVHTLAEQKGKVVVLEWVNPDCPFVKRHYQAKTMKTLSEKFAGKEVVWLAINSTHYADQAANKAFVAAESLAYAVLDDHDGAVGHQYGARTTPDMFVVDPEGKVAYRGAIDDDPFGDKAEKVNYVDAAVPAVLAKSAVAMARTQPYGCSVKYKD